MRWITEAEPFLGIAATDARRGENVRVTLYGVSNAHTELDPSKVYYISSRGTLTTEETSVIAGLGLSRSQLLIDRK